MDKRWIDPDRSYLNQSYRSSRWQEWEGDPRKAAAVLHHGRKKLTQDSILLRGIIIQASPEVFFPEMQGWTQQQKDDPANYAKRGPLDADKVKAFWEKSIDALKERYGDYLLEAHLHLDESGPHIHAEVIPYNEEKQAISNNSLFPGAKSVSAFHTWLHEKIGKPLGLDRSQAGNKREATKEAYTPPPDLMEQMTDERQAAIVKTMREHPEEHWKMARTIDKAITGEDKAIIAKQKTQLHDYSQEISNLRGIDVREVFERAGYEWRNETGHWRGPEGQKIGIQGGKAGHGQKFIDDRNKEASGGYGAIDAAMYIMHGKITKRSDRQEFIEALDYLRSMFGTEKTAQCWTQHPETQTDAAAQIEAQAKELDSKPPILPNRGDNDRKQTALIEMERRGVKQTFLKCAQRGENTFYIDWRSNILFPCPGGGWLATGTITKPGDHKPKFKQSIGSQKAPYHKKAPRLVAPEAKVNKRIALCEGIQDAFALAAFDPYLTIYIVNGNEYLPLPDGIQPTYICMDADQAGIEHATKMKELYPNATILPPPEPFSDWSDYRMAYVDPKQKTPAISDLATYAQRLAYEKAHPKPEPHPKYQNTPESPYTGPRPGF